MEYKLLSSLYYTDKKTYETEYSNRLNSANTVKPDIDISGSPAFILITDEISHMISSIQSSNRTLGSLSKKMDTDSLQIYRSSQLSYEAVMTNDLEGVASTRKDILSILEKIRKNKNFRGAAKKFHGMVKSYDELVQNTSVSIKTCKDIRSIYDKIALPEVISSDKQNKPNGQYFRKDTVDVLNVKSGKVIHSGVYDIRSSSHIFNKKGVAERTGIQVINGFLRRSIALCSQCSRRQGSDLQATHQP